MSQRGAREPWVARWWRGDAGPAGSALSLVTLPLAGLYWIGQRARSEAFARGLLGTRRAPIPVVSVGNLVVGGSGKTPVTSWIARALLERGVRPAVLLRGYGRDELLLHRRWTPDALVVVGADRVISSRDAARAGAGVAVLDDGFQHRRLARDLDLVLVAAEHPLPGRLLPRGPYREPPEALGRADLVVVTRRTADDATTEAVLGRVRALAPGKAGPVLRLAPAGWTGLEGAPAGAPHGPLLAVASVAGPEHFVRSVAALTGEAVSLLAFPDHHDYRHEDVGRILREADGRTVVTTEKDAVKLAPLGALPAGTRVLTLAVEPERGVEVLERALDAIVAGLADRRGRRAAPEGAAGQPWAPGWREGR